MIHDQRIDTLKRGIISDVAVVSRSFDCFHDSFFQHYE